MPFTNEFRSILRKNKQKFGVDKGYEKAINQAVELGVKPFYEGKNKKNRSCSWR